MGIYDYYYEFSICILLNSILLSSLALSLSCAFICTIFLCLLILSNFVSFYVLGQSTRSPAVESSGLMEKRSYGALQCDVSWSAEPNVSGLSVMYIVYTLLL